MEIFIDINTKRLRWRNPSDYVFTSGAQEDVSIRFLDGNTVVDPAVTGWAFVLKDEFSNIALATSTSATKVGSGSSAYWVMSVDLNTAEAIAALGDESSIKVYMQVDYTVGAVVNNTKNFQVYIENDGTQSGSPPSAPTLFATAADLSGHIADLANPHQVTAAQVGGANIVIEINTALGGTGWQSGGAGATNLTWNASTGTVESSTGSDASLTDVDGVNSGLMTSAQFNKLAAIEAGSTADQTGSEIVGLIDTELGGAGWQTSSATNLGYTPSTRTITSSTGSDVVIPLAVASGDAGLFSGADKSKLDGVDANAADDQTGTEIRDLLDTLFGDTVWRGLDMGTFTGDLIGDNLTLLAALQAIETGVEGYLNDKSTPIALLGSTLDGNSIDFSTDRVQEITLDADCNITALNGSQGYSGVILVKGDGLSSGFNLTLSAGSAYSGESDTARISTVSMAMGVSDQFQIHLTFGENNKPTIFVGDVATSF